MGNTLSGEDNTAPSANGINNGRKATASEIAQNLKNVFGNENIDIDKSLSTIGYVSERNCDKRNANSTWSNSNGNTIEVTASIPNIQQTGFIPSFQANNNEPRLQMELPSNSGQIVPPRQILGGPGSFDFNPPQLSGIAVQQTFESQPFGQSQFSQPQFGQFNQPQFGQFSQPQFGQPQFSNIGVADISGLPGLPGPGMFNAPTIGSATIPAPGMFNGFPQGMGPAGGLVGGPDATIAFGQQSLIGGPGMMYGGPSGLNNVNFPGEAPQFPGFPVQMGGKSKRVFNSSKKRYLKYDLHQKKTQLVEDDEDDDEEYNFSSDTEIGKIKTFLQGGKKHQVPSANLNRLYGGQPKADDDEDTSDEDLVLNDEGDDDNDEEEMVDNKPLDDSTDEDIKPIKPIKQKKPIDDSSSSEDNDNDNGDTDDSDDDTSDEQVDNVNENGFSATSASNPMSELDIVPFYSSESSSSMHPYVRNRFK